MIDPAAWLRARGFNPDGDLCKTVKSKRSRYSTLIKTSTAMCEAARAGELSVCRFLCEHGAASTISVPDSPQECTPVLLACQGGHLEVAQWLVELGGTGDIRTADICDQTPFLLACVGGHLEVAQWLFGTGAAGDINEQTTDEYGQSMTLMYSACRGGHLDLVKWLYSLGATKGGDETLLHAACSAGHLDVAKWLFEVGVAEDIRARTVEGCTLMRAATNEHFVAANLDVVQWLALSGCANDEFDRVNREIIHRDVPAQLLPALCASVQRLINEHAAFFVVLASVRFTNRFPRTTCVAPLLLGHEQSAFRIIADFAGVLRGRQLRNARAVLRALPPPLEHNRAVF